MAQIFDRFSYKKLSVLQSGSQLLLIVFLRGNLWLPKRALIIDILVVGFTSSFINKPLFKGKWLGWRLGRDGTIFCDGPFQGMIICTLLLNFVFFKNFMVGPYRDSEHWTLAGHCGQVWCSSSRLFQFPVDHLTNTAVLLLLPLAILYLISLHVPPIIDSMHAFQFRADGTTLY